MIIAGLVSGAIAGAIIIFFSHVAPYFGVGNFVRDLDQPHVFNKKISRRESHLLGILVFSLVSCLFGGLYTYFVERSVFVDFSFISIAGWGFLMAIFFGGVVMPLEGHGIFGVKEDVWYPVDLVLANFIWAILYWWIIKLWPYLLP
ncbi:MAG: hypothetical protein ABIB04_02750 [Patescibacteria group bacterium]